jgi:hypothetical protein
MSGRFVVTPLHKNTPANLIASRSPMVRARNSDEIADVVLCLTDARLMLLRFVAANVSVPGSAPARSDTRPHPH